MGGAEPRHRLLQWRLHLVAKRVVEQLLGQSQPTGNVGEVAIGQFRTMVERAQSQTPIAPAMLAQIASMARNLLAR